MMAGSCKFIDHNNSLCNCIATPKDIIMHLKNTDKNFNGVNLYQKKCYSCGHAYSVHCLQTQSKLNLPLCFKKFLTMIIVSNCFKVICTFLTWEDIIVLDQSFVNNDVRPLWMMFLIDKFEVKATGFSELLKKTNWLKIKYLTTVKKKLFLRFLNIVNNDCFSCVTSFLTLKEMSILDRAFVNKGGRHLWNLFLKEKYEFIIIGFNKLSQLWMTAKWLKLKQSSATLLQIKYSEPDLWRNGRVVFENRSLIHATLLNSRLKELVVEMAENWYQNQHCVHFIFFASHKCKNLCTLRLIFPESREWNLKYFIAVIVKECLNLSEIYIENIKVDEIIDLFTILGARERNLLNVLSLRGEKNDHASVTSFNCFMSSHLHTLTLKQIHLCNTDLNTVVNNIKTLKILNVINVHFNDKLLSNWMSTSVEEFIFHNCCYIVNNEDEDDLSLYVIDYGYQFRCLENVLSYLKMGSRRIAVGSEMGFEDYLWTTFAKYDDDKRGEIIWPIYDEFMYIGIKMEFSNIYLPNLNTLNVNKDSLVTEESLISQIIQKGNNLYKIYIFNWHCTDLSLDAIGDSCPHLSTIGLYVDDLRMTEAGLKRLIDKCLQLKFIVLHYNPTKRYDMPVNRKLDNLFQNTFQTRNIQCYWDDLNNDQMFNPK